MALLDRPEDRTDLGIVYAMTGRRAEAFTIARSISKPGLNPDPMSLARTLLLIGDKDSGFVWLTKAVDAHHPAVYGLKIFPMFDNVRSDPRFQALVTRMKLPLVSRRSRVGLRVGKSRKRRLAVPSDNKN